MRAILPSGACRSSHGGTGQVARVFFPEPLRAYTGGLEACEVGGTSVGEVMGEIGKRFPALVEKLFREEGVLRAIFIIYLDGRDIRVLERERTPVASESMIRIVPAIAGG